MKKCVYCGTPASYLDLCHARVPVCDQHTGLGHQLAALPPPPQPVATAPRKARR